MLSKNRLTQSVFISVMIIVTLLTIAKVRTVQDFPVQPQQEIQNSCMRPSSDEMKIYCADIEASILAVTVRIEMHAQYDLQGYTNTKTHPSHATIMAGRYLVTHNHFKFLLTEQAANGEEGYIAISLYRADGNLILDRASLDSFSIVHADAQILVLEFLNLQGNGLFSSLGLPSANFVDWQDANLQAGVELAQIDWDGERAHVDWTPIEVLQLADAVPQLQMDNFARFGCSGGGVFLNGQHIGNNWARNIEENPATDQVSRRYSIIALNTSAILELAN